MTAAVSVEGLSKRFRLYRDRNQSLKGALLHGRRASYEDFWALRDITFDIPQGTTFGLIGENGSGKSTLLKCIAKILVPDKGRVSSTGRIAALLELGSGFHPELSGRENVYLNGSILGLSKRALEAKFDEIVHFSGIEPFIDQPVKNYSSGMYVRLGFAIAINVEPDILLVDEVLAVGDEQFQRRCEERFTEFRTSGRTVVLVSHAMSAMRNLCDQIARLQHGVLLDVGAPGSVVDGYVDASHEDRLADGDGGIRWGSGEARVERIEVLTAGGRPTTSLRTGDAVTLRLHYAAEERIIEPVFGWSLETADASTYVWAHHSRDGEMIPEAIEGRGHVDLVVDSLPLQPGAYDLSVSIVSTDTLHVYDHRKRLLRFDVGFGTPRESGGLVVLNGVWQRPVVD